MPDPSPKTDIKELSLPALRDWLGEQGIAPYRAGQIFKWVYRRGIDDFGAMTDLKKEIRSLLFERFFVGRLDVRAVDRAADGTAKYLFRLSDGEHIETVLIPEREHHTLCVSSQVGCAQGCTFCHTAAGGFVRNLTPGEIIGQVRDVGDLLPPDDPRRLTNLVFMGMGEPLANHRSLQAALTVLTGNEAGLAFSGRRITVSTAGLVPRLADLGREADVNLAISLNATDNKTRDRLMPINRRFPIEALLEACRKFPLRPHRRITVEYILMAGVNDSPEEARRLVKLLRPIRAKINLIPFNEHPASPFRRPDDVTVARFQRILADAHYTAIVRHSKGTEISAACGQLRGMDALEGGGISQNNVGRTQGD